jgi:hypothetical protein
MRGPPPGTIPSLKKIVPMQCRTETSSTQLCLLVPNLYRWRVHGEFPLSCIE